MNKGILVIAGGNLAANEARIHREFLRSARSGDAPKFGIIPSASGEDPVQTIVNVIDLWRKLGVEREHIVVVPAFGGPEGIWPDSAAGDEDEIIEAVRACSGLWFTGGDQIEIAKAFLRRDGSDTRALAEIRRMLREGGAVGGTSAGAAMMSDPMLEGGNNITALTERPVWVGPENLPSEDDERMLLAAGLGFFQDGIVDQHFDRRIRLLRLTRAAALRTGLGFGVSEDTAMIVDYARDEIRIVGGGGLYFIDLRQADTAENGGDFRFRNARLAVLREGDLLRIARDSGGNVLDVACELRKP